MRHHLTLASLVFLLSVPAPAANADSAGGDNGRIAYSELGTDNGGTVGRVWAVDPDGTNRQALLAGRVDDHSDPSWSPDGLRIAFYRHFSLIVAAADGSEEREVLRGQPGRAVTWSPDGTRIAYAVQNQLDKGTALWIMNADGTDPHEIYRADSLNEPAWSPLGDEIAFRADGPYPNSDDSVIYAIGVDGTGLRQVTQPVGPDPGLHHDEAPTWSPDGTFIAFASNRDRPATGFPPTACFCDDLYLQRSDGSGVPTRLADSGFEVAPEWSPDGSSLAYVSQQLSRGGGFVGTVKVRDLLTGAVRQIDSGSVISVSWAAMPGSRPSADLVASLSADRTSVLPGTAVTLTATVRNDGPAAAELAAVEVRVAPGSVFDPAGNVTCTPVPGGALSCALGDLPPGGQASVIVGTTTGPAGVGEASALATSATSDPVTTDNRATLTVAVCTQVGSAGTDRLRGTQAPDVLCGGEGDDVLVGGGGGDVLVGGPGRDRLQGGRGNDTASYAQAGSRVRIDLARGRANGDGQDRLRGMENAVGGRYADRLWGSPGGNVLIGGSGDDWFAPGGGRDHVTGGLDHDRLDYRDAEGAVHLDLKGGVAPARASTGGRRSRGRQEAGSAMRSRAR